MKATTIVLPDATLDKLCAEADRLGVSVDELIAMVSEDFFERKSRFESIAQYLLVKNAELYRRLAR